MGLAALIVFLCSLLLGILCLFVLGWAALGIYKTVRYGYKDLQPWAKVFGEFNDNLQGTLDTMEQRSRNITRIGLEMRESVDDIHDTMEELRHHPLLRASQFVGKHRS